jgi:hypothetical protein
MMTANYNVENGKIPGHLAIDESIVRYIARAKDELDDDDPSSFVAQGHLSNGSRLPLVDVTLDLSYYCARGEFLGLTKHELTGLFGPDKIEAGARLPFSFDLDIPDGTVKCLLSATARRHLLGGIFG